MTFKKTSICLERSTLSALRFSFPHRLKRNAFVQEAIEKALKEKRIEKGFSK